MERVDIAWENGDYETLRKLLHPGGSWVLLSSDEPRTITGRDELVEALRAVRETTSYRIYTMKHEVLGANVVLASGYVRTPSRHGQGHDMARRYFLLEAKDGLFIGGCSSSPRTRRARRSQRGGTGRRRPPASPHLPCRRRSR
jgi:hypothetical protein